eukprot:m.83335 g.83335  ORF g.83335 m.83335 type:complete len:250 (-) comp12916_c0_seq3:302-1051(-)
MTVGETVLFTLDKKESAGYAQLATVLRRQHRQEHSHSHSHSCALGAHEDDADLHRVTESNLEYEVELVKVEEAGEFDASAWELSVDEKLQAIPVLRTTGNELFQAEKFSAAGEKYKLALSYLESLETIHELDERDDDYMDSLILEASTQSIPLLLNLAACQLKDGQFQGAIDASTMVLKKEPNNIKALFRRGKAHLLIRRNTEEALADLKRANELSPNDKNIKRALQDCLEQTNQQNKKDSEKFRGMFG